MELTEKIAALKSENAALRAKLSKSEERLGLFLQCDRYLIYSGVDKRWFVHYDDQYNICELSSGATEIEAVDTAIAKGKGNAEI